MSPVKKVTNSLIRKPNPTKNKIAETIGSDQVYESPISIRLE